MEIILKDSLVLVHGKLEIAYEDDSISITQSAEGEVIKTIDLSCMQARWLLDNLYEIDTMVGLPKCQD